ncbi:MAG: DsbA family protein [Chloroflexi bacterium]|nr:DsbA family protein [Chloroflexota bacterium]MBV9896791.1 DsbA family protein [Chloroflexota bacterium]
MPTDPTRVDLYFDPLCPWCWRTALWLRDVARRQPVSINWKLFSLTLVNHPEDYGSDQFLKWFELGRVLVAARNHGGNEALERLYMSLGEVIHGEQRREDLRAEAGVVECLTKAGLPESLYKDALNDPNTESALTEEHTKARERLGAFGVPTLALEGSDIAIFGPVIEPIPSGEEADTLWEHTRWLLQQPYVWEFKRERKVKLQAQHVTA